MPLVIFCFVYGVWGVWPALLATLAWDYACVARRLLTRKRIPGMLVLGTTMLTLRTVLALASGSTFVYFLQPSLTTIATAVLLVATATAANPLVARIVHDVMPLRDGALECELAKKAVRRLSYLWALEHVLNASASVTLLMTQTMGVFVITSKFTGWALGAAALAASIVLVRRTAPGLLTLHPVLPNPEDSQAAPATA